MPDIKDEATLLNRHNSVKEGDLDRKADSGSITRTVVQSTKYAPSEYEAADYLIIPLCKSVAPSFGVSQKFPTILCPTGELEILIRISKKRIGFAISSRFLKRGVVDFALWARDSEFVFEASEHFECLCADCSELVECLCADCEGQS